MDYRVAAAVIAASAGIGATPIRAAGPDFGYVYTAQTEEAGETELSAWATDRRG
jgi:hypothetical protein